MKRLVIDPAGWPCTLGECPPGLFVFNNTLGFKSEYGVDDPYCVGSGEIFWGGTKTKEDRVKLMVQPVVSSWEEFEV